MKHTRNGTVELHDWAISSYHGTPCQVLYGKAIKHPRLGTMEVRTSRIVDILSEGDELVAYTQNTRYVLSKDQFHKEE